MRIDSEFGFCSKQILSRFLGHFYTNPGKGACFPKFTEEWIFRYGIVQLREECIMLFFIT